MFNRELPRQVHAVTPEAMRILTRYCRPGSIRDRSDLPDGVNRDRIRYRMENFGLEKSGAKG